jgi:hypothetical protein
MGGRIELADDGSLPEGVRAGHAEQGRLRYERLLSDSDRPGKAEHCQFSGASLALTAEMYAEAGGLELLTDLDGRRTSRRRVTPPWYPDRTPALREGDDIAPSAGKDQSGPRPRSCRRSRQARPGEHAGRPAAAPPTLTAPLARR